jgi:hypothetical protein
MRITVNRQTDEMRYLQQEDYILVEPSLRRRLAAALIDESIAVLAVFGSYLFAYFVLGPMHRDPLAEAFIFLGLYGLVSVVGSTREIILGTSLGQRRMRLDIRQLDGAPATIRQCVGTWWRRHWPSFLLFLYLVVAAIGGVMVPVSSYSQKGVPELIRVQQLIALGAGLSIASAGAWVLGRRFGGRINHLSGTKLFYRRRTMIKGAFEPVVLTPPEEKE